MLLLGAIPYLIDIGVGVGRFFHRQQCGVLGVQRLDRGELLQAQGIKMLLCSLVQQDVGLMLLPEPPGITALAVGNIGIAGLDVVDDLRPQDGDLCHAGFRRFDFVGQLSVFGEFSERGFFSESSLRGRPAVRLMASRLILYALARSLGSTSSRWALESTS